jgi:hypothetical protein
MSDGTKGAPLPMLALFQAYDRAVQWRDDNDLVEEAQQARAELDAQIERARAPYR